MSLSPRKEKAAKLLAIGDSIEDVATAVSRSENTIRRWLLVKDFQAVIVENLAGAALVAVVEYLTGGTDAERARLGLSVLKMRTAKGQPGRPRKEIPDDDEDETDISEFSAEQIGKLTGDDA